MHGRIPLNLEATSPGGLPALPAHCSLRSLVDLYLDDCFRHATPPRVGELSYRLGLSPTRLIRAFLAEHGIPPSHYLGAARVDRAKHLLRTTTLSATAIAYRAGFGTRMTFFRAFKRATGLTPDTWRASTSPPVQVQRECC